MCNERAKPQKGGLLGDIYLPPILPGMWLPNLWGFLDNWPAARMDYVFYPLINLVHSKMKS